MKTLITILIFAFALVLTSCEKEKTPTSEYITYEFKIVSPKKRIPLANLNLLFYQTTWHNYRDFTITLKQYATTDNQGNASFTFKTPAVVKKPNVQYHIMHIYNDSLPFDSTNVNFRYYFTEEVLNNDKKVIEAYDGCYLRVYFPEEDYKAMKFDSVYLETPFRKYMNVSIGLDYLSNDIECSTELQIKYYYFVKGVKSKEYTKNIYISRRNELTSGASYKLEF